jgi:hypothetical protein
MNKKTYRIANFDELGFGYIGISKNGKKHHNN